MHKHPARINQRQIKDAHDHLREDGAESAVPDRLRLPILISAGELQAQA